MGDCATGQPDHIFVIGYTGSGKTCFLSGLHEFGRAHQDGGLSVLHDDVETAGYLEDLSAFRQQGQWPPPTSGTAYLRLTLRSGGLRPYVGRLHVPDYQGDDLRKYLQEAAPEVQTMIGNSLALATGLLILLDPTKDVDIGLPMACEPDETHRRQDLILKTVGDVLEGRIARHKTKTRPHIMLVITKADRLLEDMTEAHCRACVVARNAAFINKLTRWCTSRTIATALVSAFGPVAADGSPPQDAKPRGYHRVLAILERWKWEDLHRRRARWGLGLVALLMLLLLCAAIYRHHVRQWHEQQIRALPIGEAWFDYEQHHWPPSRPVPQYIVQAMEQRFASERQRLAHSLKEHRQDQETLRNLRNVARWLVDRHVNAQQRTDRSLVAQINNLLETGLWDQISSTNLADPQLPDLCMAYLREFPNGQHVDAVRALSGQIIEGTVDRIIAEIRSLRVSSREHLRTTARLIQDLRDIPNIQDILAARNIPYAEISTAAELAEALAGASGIRLELRRLEHDGYGKRYHRLVISDGTATSGGRAMLQSPSKSTVSTYSGHYCDVDIDRSQTITWELHAAHARRPWNTYSVMATFQQPLWTLLGRLCGTRDIPMRQSGDWPRAQARFRARAWIREGTQWRRITPEEAHCYDRYIGGSRGWRARP